MDFEKKPAKTRDDNYLIKAVSKKPVKNIFLR